jgi:two-component system LytT family sensor kinase
MLEAAVTRVRDSAGPREMRETRYPSALLVSTAWVLIGTLAYARHYLQSADRELDGRALAEYCAWLVCYVSWIALTPAVLRLERCFPLGRPGGLRHLGVLALLSLPAALAASSLTLVIGFAGRALFALPVHLPDPVWAARELVGHAFLYWSAIGASWMLRTLIEARENERRAARLLLETSRLETSLRQADLDALRSRLDPHFLFNSLQNISVLVQHDPEKGSRMLTKLGDLLRVSLRRDPRPETTLEAEVALTRAYLAIEQMRFGDRLSSRIELQPGTEQAMVPTFLLQPLVENAIRHGLEPVRQEGRIDITSRIEGGSLVLIVTDNGAGPPAEPLSEQRMGIGLGATCNRLALMYPNRHTFAISAAPGSGAEVRITLPLNLDTREEVIADAHVATADRRR